MFLDLVARLRRREDAEDALQATFLSAWTQLPRLRRPERFVAWLFRIARNQARDLSRRAHPRPVLVGGGEDLIDPGVAAPPEVESLRTLMAGLKPETRAVVLLRAVEGWSTAEVAAAHGVSPSTIRRRYAKALKHLRAALAREEDHEKEHGDRASRRRVV